jgi:transposase
MTDDEQSLPNDIEQLKAMLLAERKQSAEQAARLVFLEEQFRLAQQQRFGSSSEGHPAQGDLFNEAEAELDAIEDIKESTPIQAKKKPVRQKLPKDLEREVIIHDLREDEKTCDCCGKPLHKMGESRSEKLDFIPAKVKVIEHVRLKYSCRTCEKEGISTQVKSAPVPPSPIPKGFATPSLLSQIITSKYQYALPLYRQESLFKQYGIALSRKTMSEWMMKCSELFKPLYEKLQKILLQQNVIQADETTLNVINEDKAKCYMWLYCTGSDAPVQSSLPNIVLFNYQSGRAGQCAVDYLDGYSGYLQVDGYAGYEKTNATLVGCWAHARRKFKEAEIAQAKGKTGKANIALSHIQKLYRLEIQLKDKTTAQKYQSRQEKAKPLLAQFYQWLEKASVPPKTALGKAIQYCKNQWHKLIRYIENGDLNIDNNRAERAVKPFVIGRKNWLFSNTGNGAKASAMHYSLIETAKANGLVPFDYLMHCLEQLSKPKVDINSLLPWNIKLS